MIAADTSTWIAFLEGGSGKDVQMLDKSLQHRQVVMIPVVLTELLSDPGLSAGVSRILSEVPRVEPDSEYWLNAGFLRAKVLSMRRKARLGDALIAQSCLDSDLSLLTRDQDFRAFAQAANLKILPPV